MSGEATDDIGLDNLDRDREEEAAEQEDEEESSFIDDERMDESILDIDRSNLVFTRPDDDTSTSERPEGSVPNVGRDAGVMKRYIISDKKQFLKNGLGITVNKGDGDSSKALYDELTITISDKTNKINGAKYKGRKILLLRGGKMVYSDATTKEPYVNEFKELLKEAYKEHQKTPAALLERRTGVDVTQDTMNSITDNVSDRIGSKIDSMMEDLTTNTEITENELRELRGLLDPKGETVAAKLEALKVESDNWKEKAREEGNTRKGKLYETISKAADLKADELRLRLNQKPETEEVINMLKEEDKVNDLARFGRFKKWARENLLGLTSVAISVASIITTVVVAGRNALKKGGDALDKLGKAVANAVKKLAKKLGENLGPIISALGTLISNIILLGAKGLLFLAENLFILVLAITYFIYNEYKSRRGSRK